MNQKLVTPALASLIEVYQNNLKAKKPGKFIFDKIGYTHKEVGKLKKSIK